MSEKYFIKTFGCQMNARDSEKLTGILKCVGYKILPEEAEEEADFVIYNTCTVRENANLKVYGRLGKLGHIKESRHDMMIALCGCMMQEPSVIEKILRQTKKAMQKAAHDQDFMEAARLRDEMFMLQKILDRKRPS